MSAWKTRTLDSAPPAEVSQAESRQVTELVDRAQAGDPRAFDDLMRLYERRIILLGIQMGLRREDSLDTCQETFIKVFRYIRRFRSGESFFKWLYRIAIHVIYDHMRRNRSQGTISLEDLGVEDLANLPEAPASLSRQVEAADLAGKLLAGMPTLSRRERTVFALRDLQQMSTEEIGGILRLSQVTVRRHCTSARQKLRARLFGIENERSGGGGSR